MTSPPPFSFARPAMPGDAVSVLVLVEDSATMAAKWPDIRDSYLPNLLQNLRAADTIVEIETRWLTTSTASSSSPPPPIKNDVQVRPYDLPLRQDGPPKFTPAVISTAIDILSAATRRQSTTRHLILVAASGPLTQGGLKDATSSAFEFEAWDNIAHDLKQYYIRLHVILSIGAEMRTYHELFKRSLQLQNNSEVPAWFQVDSRRYSIRLSGRPQYVRSSALPIPLVPTVIPEDPYSNPSPPESSSTPVSPPATVSTPSSPNPSASPSARKSSASPTTQRSRPRPSDPPQSPPAQEGGNLVSYLQQMHGLTKKKSYGIKAPKKTYADVRSMPNAGRPILPRLEVPQSQSDIYTYPSFDTPQGTDLQTPSSDPQFPPPRRHSMDQLPTASLVARTSNEDRRARRRAGPWLPIAPLASSTPSSPTATSSPSRLAALQSLASMTPRLPDFVHKDRMGAGSISDPRIAFPGNSSGVSTSPPNGGYYPGTATQWGTQSVVAVPALPSAPSPPQTLSATSSMSDSSRFQTSPATPSLAGSDYTYGSSPASSAAATPSSLSATVESGEDQPFVVSPEYEALVNARFEEAVRSGAMQASMTSATGIHPAATPPTPVYVPAAAARLAVEQGYYSAPYAHGHEVAVMSAVPDVGYPVYQPEEMTLDAMQANGGWQYATYAPEYAQQPGAWYPS